MDCGRRNTKKCGFRCPDLKVLRKLSSFVLDPLDFKQLHGKLLSILSIDVVEGLLSVLEYAHHLGIPVSSKVPFSGLEEIPRSHLIAEALHLKKSEIEGHWEIIDSCGEFSNVPLIGTYGGINYNPALARHQLRFPMRDKPNNKLLEGLFYQKAYTTWVKKRALELNMPYPCEIPMSMVVVETLTLPIQDVEELEDALAKMKRGKFMWEERFHALS
ncbi:hypothetical protein KIW84_066088 [Lathyrus oleraceus]|uniref:DUF7745 domain-containing protein n=1 Tax=Pisum sativum TaxID=3888 RepID=A0A9D5AB65_PEA|nr:hypothetical protein KIW84_066088 [Pisum sativum]